ncbi:MAG: penicillin-binding protein 2 [Legionellaceae bacterium]
MRNNSSEHHAFRLSLLMAMIIICAFILILRLAYLQVSQYKRFATLSLKNQMSILPLAPPRGLIFDRNGVVLADNIAVFVLEIIPERIKNLPETLNRLQHLLPSVTDDEIENFNRARKQNRSFVPIPFKLKLTSEEVAIFASNQHLFPGISIKARLIRSYPFGEICAHFIGYVGRINNQELQQVNASNYRASNFIGKAGIERFYEDRLHGQIGYQQTETDVNGRTLRILSKQSPIAGDQLYLTIDARLQEIAHHAMNKKQGAIVVMDVHQGEILALVSTPSYDPNLFINGISHQAYNLLANAEDKPLYNRAVRGLYPPASTVKPFVALAGLEKGVINQHTKIYDPGWYRLPHVTRPYRDWKRGGHGIINLKRALTVSCDTYFYQLGNKMGITPIEDMLSQFGYGQLTHVDLKEEAPGLLPSPHWKQQTKGQPWYPGDTLISSIGQGFMLASPLQLANATASLSQHGRRFRPHLLKAFTADQGRKTALKPLEEYPIQLKDNDNWRQVIEAMQAVISSPEGTAGSRFGRNAPYTVAGKTGTAQVFSLSQDEKKRSQQVPEKLRDHSLFIAFAPVDNPEIAIAVVLEHDTVAPILARQIMDAYFNLNPHETKHEKPHAQS